jgi:hypothetical protein
MAPNAKHAGLTVSLAEPPSPYIPQSAYALHPVPMDGLVQCGITFHRGDTNNVIKVSIPTTVDRITVAWVANKSDVSMALCEKQRLADHLAATDLRLYDTQSGELLMELEGFKANLVDVVGESDAGVGYAFMSRSPVLWRCRRYR